MPPQVFLGAAANPFAPPYDYRPLHLAKKIAAGAQFIQTQYCYDMPLLRALHGEGARAGAASRNASSWSASARWRRRAAARWMRANVPGIHIPDPVIARLEGAKDQKLEGKKICIELIQQIREIEGVAGHPCDGLSPGRARLGHHHRHQASCEIARRAVRPRKGLARNMTDTVISSATKEVVIGFERPFVLIGERINPTGRKLLAAEMAAGDYSRVQADALAQVEAGAHMLDVNAGIPLADEPRILAETIQLVQSLTDVPLSIDSSIVDALEAGLEVYKGKAAAQFGHRRGGAAGERAAAGEEIRRRGRRHLQ